jgi:hypothetical protein
VGEANSSSTDAGVFCKRYDLVARFLYILVLTILNRFLDVVL